MLKFYRVVILITLGAVWPFLSFTGQAETLRFAWPDGASAKVHARSEGRRVKTSGEKLAWDMSCDFTMSVRRTGDRVVVSSNDFSDWKGTLPPNIGGGAERFIDMIPTFIVSEGGAFLGIEGHETARKLMTISAEQSGGLDPMTRKLFGVVSSNASLEAIANDHWSVLVVQWLDVELDPDTSSKILNVTSLPQLGGGEVEIIGTVKFVKETPCASGPANWRCVHLHAETGADKMQVSKILQSLLRQMRVNVPTVTALDLQFKVDIVVDKATMLPQQLTINRLHTINLRMQGRDDGVLEEITKNYTFAWRLPNGERKR